MVDGVCRCLVLELAVTMQSWKVGSFDHIEIVFCRPQICPFRLHPLLFHSHQHVNTADPCYFSYSYLDLCKYTISISMHLPAFPHSSDEH